MSTVHLRKLLMQGKNNPKINIEGPISVTKALAIIGKNQQCDSLQSPSTVKCLFSCIV